MPEAMNTPRSHDRDERIEQQRRHQQSIAGLLRYLPPLFEALAAVLKIGALAVLVVFITGHWSYFSHLLDRVTHFEGWGMKFDLAAASSKIDRLVQEKADTGAKLPFAQAALTRAARVLPALDGSRVLWVDGNPGNNVLERGVLEDIGIKVQLALSTRDAVRLAETDTFDLVISNMIRPDDVEQPLKTCPAVYFDFPSNTLRIEYLNDLVQFNLHTQSHPPAGFALAEAFAERWPTYFADRQIARIIFYTAASGGIAASACARIVTNRPDVLLQSVISALEELRWRQLTNTPENR
jgi:hypothetical protein